MKRKSLLIPILAFLLCSIIIPSTHASPPNSELIEYLLVLEPIQLSDVHYPDGKVLQRFTQIGEVFINEDGEEGEYLGTIELEVFYLVDLNLLKGIAVAQFTMLLEDDTVLVEGVAEVRIALEIVGIEVLQTMTGRFSGHGDRNMHGTVRDNERTGDQVILEGYAIQ